MGLGEEDRRKIQSVRLCGPKTVEFLDRVGIGSFAELADADARELRLRINAYLGRPHINEMGVRALQNLIDAAKAERGG